jgi:hypothetical protein
MPVATIFVLSQARPTHRHVVTMFKKRKCRVVRPTKLLSDSSPIRVVDFHATDVCQLVAMLTMTKGVCVVANVDVNLGERDDALQELFKDIRIYEKDSSAILSDFVSDVWNSVYSLVSVDDIERLSRLV